MTASHLLDDVDLAEASPFDGNPIPLTPTVVDKPFPVDALPLPYAEMVGAVAEATQTDPAMAAVTALTVLAAAAGGRAEVEVRRGWRELLCLYTATIAGPGERKSAVQQMLAAPLLDAEHDLVEAGKDARREAETLHQIAVKTAERARHAAASADGEHKHKLDADALSAAALAEAITVPAVPRIIADDTTPEAAASLLAAQGGRLAIISSEGGIFDIIAGRYNNHIPSLDLWLKGHSGDSIKVDRKGREPEYIRRPALTLGLMLQPQVLTTIGRHQTFRGRGLLARFLYSSPTSYVGTRNSRSETVPDDTADKYGTAVKELTAGLAGWTDPAILQLDEDAAEVMIQVAEATEPELGGDGVLASLADWGSKYVGAVARIAGLLHLAEHGHQGVRVPVRHGTVLSAVRIGTYFKANAIRAFAAMQMTEGTADASYLLDQLRKAGGDEVSKRDLYFLSRARFKTVAEMDPALTRLVDHGYLAPLPQDETKRPGRRPSPRYAIHPTVVEAQR